MTIEDEEVRLVAAGFRTIKAHEAEPGMTGAYIVTMFGFQAEEHVRTGKILEVYYLERGRTVVIRHETEDGESFAEEDWDEEIWVRD